MTEPGPSERSCQDPSGELAAPPGNPFAPMAGNPFSPLSGSSSSSDSIFGPLSGNPFAALSGNLFSQAVSFSALSQPFSFGAAPSSAGPSFTPTPASHLFAAVSTPLSSSSSVAAASSSLSQFFCLLRDYSALPSSPSLWSLEISAASRAYGLLDNDPHSQANAPPTPEESSSTDPAEDAIKRLQACGLRHLVMRGLLEKLSAIQLQVASRLLGVPVGRSAASRHQPVVEKVLHSCLLLLVLADAPSPFSGEFASFSSSLDQIRTPELRQHCAALGISPTQLRKPQLTSFLFNHLRLQTSGASLLQPFLALVLFNAATLRELCLSFACFPASVAAPLRMAKPFFVEWLLGRFLMHGRLNHDLDSAECPICFEPLSALGTPDSDLVMLMPCRHASCFRCVSAFPSSLCPFCRAPYANSVPCFILSTDT